MFDDFYGDKFKWFIGIVKDTHSDGKSVRVRIFGVHRMDDVTDVSDRDLPRAVVLMPNTGSQTGGGHTGHSLTYGTWVMGFFADGDNCQQPIIVGVIDGSYGSVNNTTTPDSTSTPRDTTGSTTTTAVTSTTSGKEKRDIIYKRLKELIQASGLSRGDIHKQISGILGNIMAEAGPNISNVNIDVVDSNGLRSHGICQWNGPRRDALFRFAGTDRPSLEQQIDFLWKELNTAGTMENRALLEVMRAQTVEDAVEGMMRFERPGGDPKLKSQYGSAWIISGGGRANKSHPEFKKRVEFAMRIYSEGAPTS